MCRTLIISLLWLCAIPGAALAYPTARFTVSEPRESGVPITFDASGSTDPTGSISRYGWDFDGDGVYDYTTDPIVRRTFPPGSHVARLVVIARDKHGRESADWAEQTIVVSNTAPAAGFTVAPAEPLTRETVRFTSTSTDPDGIAPGDHAWDLDGDGRFDDATGITAVHSFRQPGPYLVRLRVQDRYGAVAVGEQPVTVGNRPPIAGFAIIPSAPRLGTTVDLASTSSDPDGAIARIRWDLDGDGGFDDATGATASTVFRTPGHHVIGIEVVDSDAGAAIARKTVSVDAPPVSSPPGLRFLSPWPIVRIAGFASSNGARITRLAVEAPRGSWVDVRCRSPRCPIHRIKRRASAGRETTVIRLRALERWLPVGTRLLIRIGKEGAVGRYVSFRIRAKRTPRRLNRCLPPGELAPVRCGALRRR
jgi:PKD repeat protein